MNNIYTIIFTAFLVLNAQTAEQIKKQIKDAGVTPDQAKQMAKDRGMTDQQIETEAQGRPRAPVDAFQPSTGSPTIRNRPACGFPLTASRQNK
mgnify:CR=1 FL=1